MATIDDRSMIAKLLESDGVYTDASGSDPRAVLIAEYTNDFGNRTWSVCYDPSAVTSLYTSPHVRDIRVLFLAMGGVTAYGRLWLQGKL